MNFKIIKQSKKNSLRLGEIITEHGKFSTPAFMPCATVGAVKTLSPAEVGESGTEIILSNTYHLYLRPGEKQIKKLGGLHNYMKWPGPILTDSGGFQVFSLAKTRKITQRGVEFTSHLDGSKHLLTPEKTIQIQIDLGSDILMPLDVCPAGNVSDKENQRAVELTLRWLEHSIKEFYSYAPERKNKGLLLFGIIQGGVNLGLRKYCVEEVLKLDKKYNGVFSGYAIGGLAVGEPKQKMWPVIKLMDKILPKNKPRYLMGVGEPEDLIKATKLGMDMFDCVLPTRLGRHGTVWTNVKAQSANVKIKKIDLRKSKSLKDKNPISKNCQCYACRTGFSKSYLAHLIRENEVLGIRLLSLHNLYFIQNLMKRVRQIDEK